LSGSGGSAVGGANGGGGATNSVGGSGGGSGTGGGAGTGQGGDIYVSPAGSDSNAGTATSPVQTLQKAQQLVRSLDADMTADIT
jgi:hypothetical protein